MASNSAILISLFLTTTSPLFAGMAPAALHSRTATAVINGSVSTNCSLTTQPITFTIGVGYIHGPKPTIYQQSSLGVRCTKGAHVTIGMNGGLYGSAAGKQFGSRSMKSIDGSYLGYELCHDSGCSTVWTASGYSYVSPSDAGSTLPVWARILTSQSQVKQGSYSDSVTVTVNF